VGMAMDVQGKGKCCKNSNYQRRTCSCVFYCNSGGFKIARVLKIPLVTLGMREEFISKYQYL
jgi:hypothetical protein